ncbi:MAG: diacylglycerol kinase family protein, partial [Clostridia bacterium]
NANRIKQQQNDNANHIKRSKMIMQTALNNHKVIMQTALKQKQSDNANCIKRQSKILTEEIFMYHIIINPLGGRGKSLEALNTVEKILSQKNIEYIVHKTEYAGHATDIARELSKTPDTKIIMMGGDGSFNEILNGIENFENVVLGFIPCGTGNDFVRSSGHPTKAQDAINLILNNNVGYIDYIDVGNRKCLNVAGAGMDVDVLIRFKTMKFFKGQIKYTMSLISTLLHLKWHKLRITIDGKQWINLCL